MNWHKGNIKIKLSPILAGSTASM
uniref:Uncharacterized protein n=1 Tax=Rhizophora mucronata TaxID=61149 RepID=A0A2P2QGI6_RHIMU